MQKTPPICKVGLGEIVFGGVQPVGNDRDVNDMNLMNLYPIILCCVFK